MNQVGKNSSQEKTLAPLVELVWNQEQKILSKPLEAVAASYVDESQGLSTIKQVLDCMRGLLVDRLSENVEIKVALKEVYLRHAILKVRLTDPSKSTSGGLEKFQDYRCSVRTVPHHHLSFLLQACLKKLLIISFEIDEELVLNHLVREVVTTKDPVVRFQMEMAIADCYHQKLKPLMEQDIFYGLKKRATAVEVDREPRKATVPKTQKSTLRQNNRDRPTRVRSEKPIFGTLADQFKNILK